MEKEIDDIKENIMPEQSDDDNIIMSQKSKNSVLSEATHDYTIENLPENHTEYDKSIKLILLGDSKVGKTSLINCLNKKNNLKHETVSLEYFNYNIKINNFIIRMQIWDTVGQEKFNSITTNYYKTTDVVIFMYAINDIKSFNNIEYWFNELIDKGDSNNNNDNINNNFNINEDLNEKNMIKILIGNKKDLNNERKVSYEMGEKLCKEKNFYFFEEINCDTTVEQNNKLDDNNNNEENKENANIQINQEEDKDCVKNLFFKIGKIVYKEYLDEQRNRVNSSTYSYEASSSMLEIAPENHEISLRIEENEKKTCCCLN